MISMKNLSEMEITASICRDSYFDFVKEFWSVVIPDHPIWNWHIPYLCNEIQEIYERVFRTEKKKYDLLVNISPGTTKSTLFSVMALPWAWTRMPSFRAINGSYTYPLALELSRKSRDIIRSEKYQEMFPYIKLRSDQDTKGHFVNNQGGMRYSAGVGGSVVGMHGHILSIDDPIDPESSVSDEELKIANRWCSETMPSRKVNKEISVTITVMQRLAQDDPSGNLLAKRKANVKHICLPAEEEDNISPPELRANYVDGLMDPIRLSRSVLQEALVDLSEYGYAGQYLQDPVPRGGGMFKVDLLRYESRPPKKFKRLVRYWDKGGASKRKDGSYTVGVKMGLDFSDRLWILDVIRIRVDSHTRECMIKDTAPIDTRNAHIGIEQEPGSGGQESAQMTARRLIGYRIFIDKKTGEKEARADPFSDQVNAGNVILVNSPWNFDYVQEMRHFPRSKFKDQIDASSGAFSMISKPLMRAGAL